MAIKTILLKRGLETNRLNITPLAGEPIFTTDENKIFIGDGTAAGGIALSYLGTELKGVANGVAELDANALVPASQLPIDDDSTSTTTLWSSQKITDYMVSGATYLGLWQADGNGGSGTPALSDGTGDNGDFYIVEVGGDADFGSGTITFNVGDRIVYEASAGKWQKVVSADAVDSVNGQTGVVILDLNDINDVNVPSPANNQILSWDDAAGEWVAVDPGSVTATEFTALNDTPNGYASGDAGKFVRVNSTENGLVFETAAIGDLSDVDTSTNAPANGQTLKWDGTNWVPSDDNAPVTSVNGETGDVVLDTDDISEGSTNLYYTDARADARIAAASIDDLSDVDTSTTAPTANDSILQWDGSNWVPVASSTVGRTTFVALNDTPANYTGAGGYTVKVKSDESGLEFVDESTVDGGTF